MHPYRVVAAVFVAAVCSINSGAPVHARERLLSLAVGSSTVVPAAQLSRVAVGDGTVAGVVPAGNQLIINGKAQGQTTVTLWMPKGRVDYTVVVTSSFIDGIEQVIRQAIDLPSVSVMQIGQSIAITGTVPDVTQRQRITDVLSRFEVFSKDKKVPVVDLVTVANPLGEVRKALASDPLLSQVRVEGNGKGDIVVSGSVHDRADAERVLAKVRSLAGANLAADGKIIDRLATETTTQIAVKVHVLEIDRTGLSQLGIRLQGANPDPNNPGNFTITDPNFVSIEGAGANRPGRALTVSPFFRLTRLAPTLDLILRSGHARVLSSPDLVTSPGQEASFLVGGEVPYAYSTGLGQVSIVFKEYGVRLKMTPTLLGNGTVETKIAPEVSDLDFQSGIVQQGFVIPALKTSKLSTDVITRDGDSVVMGGLLRRVEQRNIDKIPLLGDLPVLGKLFRSTQYRSSETDVVFIMTPDVIVR